MSTQTSTHSDLSPTTAPERSSSAAIPLGFAIMGCFVAGAIGLYKATIMTTGPDVLLCVLGSVAAFGTVAYIYLRRD
ncbi:MAG: hypothetical protein M3463_22420 [Verrucomicrobiota bacterium]|nr:hypothetical protein [Verrucomicrobiota bacterium]